MSADIITATNLEQPEEWRGVPGFDQYEVSDQGRVRSLRKGRLRIMRTSLAGFGYSELCLWRDFKRYHRYIHFLVLEAFVGPRPEGLEACHGNGDRLDNRLSNLRWGTHSENVQDTIRHGTYFKGERCWKAKLTDALASEVMRRWRAGERQAAIARGLKVSTQIVNRVVRGKTWKHLNLV